MRTKEDFIKRWRNHLAGMALYGVASETRDGPLVRASKVLNFMPDEKCEASLSSAMLRALAADARERRRRSSACTPVALGCRV